VCVAASPVDGAECVLRTQSAVRRFKNSDVSLEPKACPAQYVRPHVAVWSSPKSPLEAGPSAYPQSPVATRRSDQAPRPARVRSALHRSHCLQQLFALPWHGWQRKVHHFMDQDSVIPKGGLVHRAAHMHADGGMRESISGTAADAGAVVRNDQKTHLTNRELTEVRTHRPRAASDPLTSRARNQGPARRLRTRPRCRR
jgi:hypothetical protein